MARATSEKVGRGPCPSKYCNGQVMFRRSSGGMLCHKCEDCGSSGFAPPGEDAYKNQMASITKPAAPDTPAPPAAVTPRASPKTPDTPMPKAPASVFNLADLL